MIDLSSILSVIIPIVTGAGGFSFAFYREQKKKKQLENSAQEHDLIQKSAQEWKELYERSDEDSRRKDDKIDVLYKENGKLRDTNNDLTTKVAILEIKKCEKRGCGDRIPPTGY